MSFFRKVICHCKQVKERIGSLRVHHADLQGDDFSQNDKPCSGSSVTPKRPVGVHPSGKRTSRGIFRKNRGVRASMTLEAVCVLPLFLFAVLNMYAAVNDIGLHVRMQTAMHQTGLPLSRYAYAYEKAAEGSEIMRSELADVAFSQTYVKKQVEEKIGGEYLKKCGVQGEVSFFQSEVLTGDDITLVAVYRLTPLFLPEQFLSFNMVNRVRLRAWTGYDNAANAERESEQIVYITQYGEVYHRSRACYHLNVSIRQTDGAHLAFERNEDGGKYYACEYCGHRRSAGVFYVTQDGTRYHTTAACGALQRTVRAVPFSQAGGRRACSVCGGET